MTFTVKIYLQALNASPQQKGEHFFFRVVSFVKKPAPLIKLSKRPTE